AAPGSLRRARRGRPGGRGREAGPAGTARRRRGRPLPRLRPGAAGRGWAAARRSRSRRDLPAGAELRGAGTRVARDLLVAGGERLLRQDLEAGAVEEEALDDPVLERVVSDHDQASVGDEEARRALEALAQGAQLVVDVDAQRLERAAGGVLAARARRVGAGDDLG